eukprot:g1381.t1
MEDEHIIAIREKTRKLCYKVLETEKGQKIVRAEAERLKQRRVISARALKGLSEKDRAIQKLRNTFDIYDVNGSNSIDLEQFKSAMKDLCVPIPSAEQLRDDFEHMDIDSDGKITFECFAQWFSIHATEYQRVNRANHLLMKARKRKMSMLGTLDLVRAKRALVAEAMNKAVRIAKAKFRRDHIDDYKKTSMYLEEKRIREEEKEDEGDGGSKKEITAESDSAAIDDTPLQELEAEIAMLEPLDAHAASAQARRDSTPSNASAVVSKDRYVSAEIITPSQHIEGDSAKISGDSQSDVVARDAFPEPSKASEVVCRDPHKRTEAEVPTIPRFAASNLATFEHATIFTDLHSDEAAHDAIPVPSKASEVERRDPHERTEAETSMAPRIAANERINSVRSKRLVSETSIASSASSIPGPPPGISGHNQEVVDELRRALADAKKQLDTMRAVFERGEQTMRREIVSLRAEHAKREALLNSRYEDSQTSTRMLMNHIKDFTENSKTNEDEKIRASMTLLEKQREIAEIQRKTEELKFKSASSKAVPRTSKRSALAARPKTVLIHTATKLAPH